MNAPQPAAPLTRVFVYGTLMPGERNAGVAERGGHFTAQPARLPGFRLFHLSPENYPGLTPGQPGDTVQGALLTYAAADWERALPFLDALEGLHDTAPLYTRQEVEVQDENGECFGAWVYVYARPERLAAPGVQFIESGDWGEVRQRERHGPDDR